MSNKNTKTVYEVYASKLANPKSLKGKSVCLIAIGNLKYIAECKKHASFAKWLIEEVGPKYVQYHKKYGDLNVCRGFDKTVEVPKDLL